MCLSGNQTVVCRLCLLCNPMTLLMPVQTQWGTHTLTQATRLLLKAALGNPLNQRFTLVCGSTLPVRPALFTYTQLMGESRSRFGVEAGWFKFHESDEVGSGPSPMQLWDSFCLI